jgi:hypothetical protein
MSCFFLKLTNTLKQPDGLIFSPMGVTSKQLVERGLQRGKTASYKIALAILYIDSAWQ